MRARAAFLVTLCGWALYLLMRPTPLSPADADSTGARALRRPIHMHPHPHAHATHPHQKSQAALRPSIRATAAHALPPIQAAAAEAAANSTMRSVSVPGETPNLNQLKEPGGVRTTHAKSTTLELLPEVNLDKVLVQPLLMHQGLFADVDENDQPTGKPLRTYIDAAARLDLQGNRDLLRRAKCLQPGGEGGMNDAQSVRSFTGDVCVARYGYPAALVKQLPEEDVEWEYESCALVGNSGRLLAEENGAAIDQHDMVLRMNLAPVKGWEAHVGTKTTFNMANHFHVSKLAWPSKTHLKGHEASEVRLGRAAARAHTHAAEETLLLFESTQTRAYYKLWEPLLHQVPATRLAILSPEFSIAAAELWWTLVEQLEREGETAHIKRRRDGTCAKHRDGSFAHTVGTGGAEEVEATCARPLSGWFALVFAARVCDRVDLYGFNGYSKARRGGGGVGGEEGGGVGGEEARSFPYHYFDQVQGETGSHNFDITIKVLQLLALQINLTIH